MYILASGKQAVTFGHVSHPNIKILPPSLNRFKVHLASGSLVTNQKSNQMNRLPLMIFGCFHSQDSQLHNKCSFCSLKNIYIYKIPQFVWRVMFRNPHERAVTTTQTKIPNNIRNVHRNMSNVCIINPQVVFKIYNR